MDCSLPGSSVHGDSPGKILEWVAMPSSRESSQPRDLSQVSHIAGRFFTDLATLVALGRGYTYDVMIINYSNNEEGPVRKKTLGLGKCKRRGKREVSKNGEC